MEFAPRTREPSRSVRRHEGPRDLFVGAERIRADERTSRGLRLIAATAHYLGRASPARERLLRVTRIIAYTDASLVRICWEAGIARAQRLSGRRAGRPTLSMCRRRALKIRTCAG
jgi:hypothetical protein